MNGPPPRTHVTVEPDLPTLARRIAGDLLTAVLDAHRARGVAQVVLTGGSTGTATLAALAEDPVLHAVPWGRTHLWWGDERFLPRGHPDRNETQARQALLDRLGLPEGTPVHPMPASDGPQGADAAAAAVAYARALRDAPDARSVMAPSAQPSHGTGPVAPLFDVVLLGVGPDGHVASLFPGHRALDSADTATVAVEDSPKPPPVRTSLTLPVLAHAHEVWLLATGSGKSEVVAAALSGRHDLPAGRVRGRTLTRWYLDTSAARALAPRDET